MAHRWARHWRAATVVVVAVAATVFTVVGCWQGVHLIEPGVLIVLSFIVVTGYGCIALTVALWPNRLWRFLAPALLLVVTLAPQRLAGEIGMRKVYAHLDRLLENPELAGDSEDDFRRFAVAGGTFKLTDVEWGGQMAMGVYCDGRRIGVVSILPQHDGSFVVGSRRHDESPN